MNTYKVCFIQCHYTDEFFLLEKSRNPILKLKESKPNIEYLSVGGTYVKALGIRSIYDLNKVTFLGFTKVLLNVFKIKKKINYTVNEIIRFNPDILFSVDSPDFTLRVAKKVKKLKPNIKTIHFVAPQVWVWRGHLKLMSWIWQTSDQISQTNYQLKIIIRFRKCVFSQTNRQLADKQTSSLSVN